MAQYLSQIFLVCWVLWIKHCFFGSCCLHSFGSLAFTKFPSIEMGFLECFHVSYWLTYHWSINYSWTLFWCSIWKCLLTRSLESGTSVGSQAIILLTSLHSPELQVYVSVCCPDVGDHYAEELWWRQAMLAENNSISYHGHLSCLALNVRTASWAPGFFSKHSQKCVWGGSVAEKLEEWDFERRK